MPSVQYRTQVLPLGGDAELYSIFLQQQRSAALSGGAVDPKVLQVLEASYSPPPPPLPKPAPPATGIYGPNG